MTCRINQDLVSKSFASMIIVLFMLFMLFMLLCLLLLIDIKKTQDLHFESLCSEATNSVGTLLPGIRQEATPERRPARILAFRHSYWELTKFAASWFVVIFARVQLLLLYKQIQPYFAHI